MTHRKIVGYIIFIIMVGMKTAPLYNADIIFDLGNVLIETDPSATINAIGLSNVLKYTSKFNNPFGLRKKLFTFLNSVPSVSINNFNALDDHQQPLPNIMCDWMTGARTCEEIRCIIKNELKRKDSPYTQTEKLLLARICALMFCPKKFVHSRRIIKEGAQFVKECKAQGHRLFVLSNWDSESFALLEEQNKEFFNLFDGIIISGAVGLLKPDPAMYQYLIDSFNINPLNSIFIDDLECNIEAVQKFGIHGIVARQSRNLLMPWKKSPDFYYIKKEMDHILRCFCGA